MSAADAPLPATYVVRQALRALAYDLLGTDSHYYDWSKHLTPRRAAALLGHAFGIDPAALRRGERVRRGLLEPTPATPFAVEPDAVVARAQAMLAEWGWDPSLTAALLRHLAMEARALAERAAAPYRRFSLYVPVIRRAGGAPAIGSNGSHGSNGAGDVEGIDEAEDDDFDDDEASSREGGVLVDHLGGRIWDIVLDDGLPVLSPFWLHCLAPEAAERHVVPWRPDALDSPAAVALLAAERTVQRPADTSSAPTWARRVRRAATCVDGLIQRSRALRRQTARDVWALYLLGFYPLAVARHWDEDSWIETFEESPLEAVWETKPSNWYGFDAVLGATTMVLEALRTRAAVAPDHGVGLWDWAETYGRLALALVRAMAPAPPDVHGEGDDITGGSMAPALAVGATPSSARAAVFAPPHPRRPAERPTAAEWLVGARQIVPLGGATAGMRPWEEGVTGWHVIAPADGCVQALGALCAATYAPAWPEGARPIRGAWFVPVDLKLHDAHRASEALRTADDVTLLLLLAGQRCLAATPEGARLVPRYRLIDIAPTDRGPTPADADVAHAAVSYVWWLDLAVGENDSRLFRLLYAEEGGEPEHGLLHGASDVLRPRLQVLREALRERTRVDRCPPEVNADRPRADAEAALAAWEAEWRSWAEAAIAAAGPAAVEHLRVRLLQVLAAQWANREWVNAWGAEQFSPVCDGPFLSHGYTSPAWQLVRDPTLPELARPVRRPPPTGPQLATG